MLTAVQVSRLANQHPQDVRAALPVARTGAVADRLDGHTRQTTETFGERCKNGSGGRRGQLADFVARRERHAAKRDGVASTADVASALEIQRCVAEEVIALEEPYRSTIVRRYFHGMTTKALAREMSVSVKTVQSRLARARDQLRARLDRRHGGNRSAWVVGLIPLLDGRSAAASSVLDKVGSLKLAAVAVVLMGVGMTLLLWPDLENRTAPMTGGRALRTAVRELPEALSDEREVTPSAVPEVWRRLLEEGSGRVGVGSL